MKLTLWSYEGPPHVGAMRVAASLKDITTCSMRRRETPTPISSSP